MDYIKIESIEVSDSPKNDKIKEKKHKSNLILNIILGFSFFLIISYYLFSAPIANKDVTMHISPNDSLTKISSLLKEKNVIRHPFLFKSIISVSSLDKNISRGDYLFKKDTNLFSVIFQILKGRHGVEKIKVTFIEGYTNEQMAKLLAEKIPSFRRDLFMSDKRTKQGYLFPDTYYFYPMSTTEEILDEMTADFTKRIIGLRSEIKDSGKSLNEIITMASILEKEANGKEDIGVISGILWKRIKLGMPLQVDIAPSTYKESGLPDSPIGNPGLIAIKAALNPINSPYLFYLHDDNGQVHYAVDFSEHRSNIARYLK